MIVKTFIGQDIKEIEESIFQHYGPEAIILTSFEVTPGQLEVNFGVEEEDFIAFQKQLKSETLDHNQSDDRHLIDDDQNFWDQETVPDVEYLAMTNSTQLESAIESKILSAPCAYDHDFPTQTT